jgi:GNAT superfamily N-acetyltransferase
MTTGASNAPAITIRAATADDVPALIAMVNAAYRRSEGDVFPTSERVDRTDAMQHLPRIVVAEVGGVVAGSIDIELSGDTAHFGMLATDVGMQGRGIGSLLVDHAEEQARAAGHTVMRIEVVKEGGRVPWYERKGYRVLRETPGQSWNGGQDWGAVAPWHMVDMEKEL